MIKTTVIVNGVTDDGCDSNIKYNFGIVKKLGATSEKVITIEADGLNLGFNLNDILLAVKRLNQIYELDNKTP